MDDFTPMLRQYRELKSQHPDCLLLFRLGDFYEMFDQDARQAAPILDLVLTSRDAGRSGRIPMCGLPYHALEGYLGRLIKAGLKVAIGEQTEDPAKARGLVKREVVRVVTAGTFIDEGSPENRCLLCLNPAREGFGLAFVEAAGGTIQANQFENAARAAETVAGLPVYECLFPAGAETASRQFLEQPAFRSRKLTLSPLEDWTFNPELDRRTLQEHFRVASLAGFGLEERPLALAACGALVEYLRRLNRGQLRHLDSIRLCTVSENLFIAPAAFAGLELENLFERMDYTRSPLGKRRLRQWLYQPLKKASAIRERQAAVELLRSDPERLEGLEELLKNLPDVEKNLSRLSGGYGSARDFLGLRNALARIPEIKALADPPAARNPLFSLADLPELRTELERALDPAAPISQSEGRLVRSGYHPELDGLRDLQRNSREGLRRLQAEEIKRTGINSLKVGYNRVFGYYLEVSKTNLHLVPEDYLRKQTLVNAERFITPKLKEFEERLLNAEERILALEAELLAGLRERILEQSAPLHRFAEELARLDALDSLARLAGEPGYVRPEVDEGNGIEIIQGRHPVVEKHLQENFIPNDLFLNTETDHLLIITGPNMAGKSTYIRQAALLVIMAQMGAAVPAGRARVGLVDRIFTRIGVHDDISRGQSTFMVEMSETAEILHNLSERSLVVLDEIGRGTSTLDGLSLAWAIAEELNRHRTRTLFATHFHELTALARGRTGVKNYNVAVRKWRDRILFLHKIVAGGSDESYGIYVAGLAGIPDRVVSRARQLLTQLEAEGSLKEKLFDRSGQRDETPSLFDAAGSEAAAETAAWLEAREEVCRELEKLEIERMTPLEALEKLDRWRKRLEKNGHD
ncbi:MAG TPA: DNA mismatch repair protein MutS [bacterium]|nr:DNA mismatch repair protein MutS [bacterium]HNS48465.1 DNA mismatch repair protein MutS [bacterium]